MLQQQVRRGRGQASGQAQQAAQEERGAGARWIARLAACCKQPGCSRCTNKCLAMALKAHLMLYAQLTS